MSTQMRLWGDHNAVYLNGDKYPSVHPEPSMGSILCQVCSAVETMITLKSERVDDDSEYQVV